MRSRPVLSLALSALATFCLCGCGTPSRVCSVTTSVTPATATLDHTKSGNSQTYDTNVSVPNGCPLPPLTPLPAPVWTVSNTVAATITEYGVASCKAAASTPITVSAGKVYGTAILICD